MKATSTTGRAMGPKPRAKKKTTGAAKAKKPVSAKAKKAAEANPNLVEDVVSVDITADVVDVTDVVDDVVDDIDPLTDLVARTKEDPRRAIRARGSGGAL